MTKALQEKVWMGKKGEITTRKPKDVLAINNTVNML